MAFLQLAAAEDEETQKRGMVGIVYYVGNFTGHFNHRLNQQVAEMSKWFPLRLTGFHLCFDDQRLQTWKPLAMLLMGKQLRIRARFHHGTNKRTYRQTDDDFLGPIIAVALLYLTSLRHLIPLLLLSIAS